jgi:molybdopterin-binding protein
MDVTATVRCRYQDLRRGQRTTERDLWRDESVWAGLRPHLRALWLAIVRDRGYGCRMPTYRLREAAALLGVSDDSLRRWADHGRLATTTDEAGVRVVDGAELAAFASTAARPQADAGPVAGESARNRFVGLVTRVVRDTVMAQVEVQCGPYRVVSLMSREAADELHLEPGVTAVAAVKSTNVVIEVPEARS